MKIQEWLSKNILGIIIGLVAVNFLIMSWGAVNWGIYSIRNSSSIFKLDTLRNKKELPQRQAQASVAQRAPLNPAQEQRAISSLNLKLTCADDDLASAFASVRPAVVNITADTITRRRGGSLAAGTVTFDDPAIRFVEEQSLGSGIIVDPRGFIVTNAHVVAKAQSLKVITFGFERRFYAAEVIIKDLINDIAILKIYPKESLPWAVLGDSDMIRVADRVLAVGSPFGLEHSVTAGIISDDSRNLIIEGQTYQDMIQTDAAINRGNSGGPLVNVKGEVIAINTAIYAPTGVFTGVGFAIPINKVKSILKEALAKRGI
jgi:S1-C subfamily serine protease